MGVIHQALRHRLRALLCSIATTDLRRFTSKFCAFSMSLSDRSDQQVKHKKNKQTELSYKNDRTSRNNFMYVCLYLLNKQVLAGLCITIRLQRPRENVQRVSACVNKYRYLAPEVPAKPVIRSSLMRVNRPELFAKRHKGFWNNSGCCQEIRQNSWRIRASNFDRPPKGKMVFFWSLCEMSMRGPK